MVHSFIANEFSYLQFYMVETGDSLVSNFLRTKGKKLSFFINFTINEHFLLLNIQYSISIFRHIRGLAINFFFCYKHTTLMHVSLLLVC